MARDRYRERHLTSFINDGNGISTNAALLGIQPSGKQSRTKYLLNIKNIMFTIERVGRGRGRDRQTETERQRQRGERDRDRDI